MQNVLPALNGLLTRFYDTLGLTILNDAAEHTPGVRYAVAAIVVALIASAGLLLYHGDILLMATVVFVLIALGLLLIVLGAAANAGHSARVEALSWTVVIAFCGVIGVTVAVGTTAFLFEYPRPLREIIDVNGPQLSLESAKLTIKPDMHGKLIVVARGMPPQPYSLEVVLFDKASSRELAQLALPLPAPDDVSDPSGTIELQQAADSVTCEVHVKQGRRTVKARRVDPTVGR